MFLYFANLYCNNFLLRSVRLPSKSFLFLVSVVQCIQLLKHVHQYAVFM